jgi:drug/metabolite transporter (DMT)-like permease
MDLSVAALALTSAFLHPFWNLLVKDSAYAQGAFLNCIIASLILGGLQALLFGVELSSGLQVWPLLVVAAAGEVLFGVTLLATYSRGDLSVYYPIIRSSPLFIVIVGASMLGHRYHAALLVGIGLVVAGAFFLQYQGARRLLHDPRTLLTAVLAMMSVGVYSLADAAALRTIDPAVRLFWVELMVAPALAVCYALRRPRERSAMMHLFGGWRDTPWRFLLIGVLAYVSYFLVLAAYKLGGNVAAVTSLRQASVPISVLLGVYYLREASLLRRMLWSLVLAVGIVVIIAAG